MERKQVTDLLNRYYTGDCSDSEEQALRYYFLSGTVAEEFKPDQELFRSLHEEKSTIPSDYSFDKLIDDSLKNDTSYSLPLKNPFYKSVLFRIAAGIALLACCGTIFYFAEYRRLDNKQALGTYSDPAIAYAETKKALQYVSLNLNHGTEKLQKLETFNKGMDRMNTLSIINLLHRN